MTSFMKFAKIWSLCRTNRQKWWLQS